MARKTSSSKTSSSKPVADVEEAVVTAALNLAADRSWSRLALADIATAAGVSLADLYMAFPSKGAILTTFSRRLDAAMVAAPAEAEAEARDRLFEVMMRRFDLLAPYKAGLRGLAHDARRARIDVLPLVCRLPRSLRWMLEAAGIATGGLKGAIRVRMLGLAYLATLRVWLEDDSPDLARTMASLDRALKRAAPFMGLHGRSSAAPSGEAVA